MIRKWKGGGRQEAGGSLPFYFRLGHPHRPELQMLSSTSDVRFTKLSGKHISFSDLRRYWNGDRVNIVSRVWNLHVILQPQDNNNWCYIHGNDQRTIVSIENVKKVEKYFLIKNICKLLQTMFTALCHRFIPPIWSIIISMRVDKGRLGAGLNFFKIQGALDYIWMNEWMNVFISKLIWYIEYRKPTYFLRTGFSR